MHDDWKISPSAPLYALAIVGFAFIASGIGLVALWSVL